MIRTKNISFVYLAQNHYVNIQVEFSIINVHTQMCQNKFPKGNVGSIKSYCFSPKGNVEYSSKNRQVQFVPNKLISPHELFRNCSAKLRPVRLLRYMVKKKIY